MRARIVFDGVPEPVLRRILAQTWAVQHEAGVDVDAAKWCEVKVEGPECYGVRTPIMTPGQIAKITEVTEVCWLRHRPREGALVHD